MRPVKTILPAALALLLTLLLAACSTGGGTPSSQASSLPESSIASETASLPESSLSSRTAPESQGQSGSVLVAYYSHTGNTEAVAQQIAELTGGTLAEIQRQEEYGDLQTEAEAEIQEGARPAITVSVDNVKDYDTIFVGYPIWWEEAPAMIATFLESYDFAGKTIVPFCTSSSDSIDNSLHIFTELCPDATIAQALTANSEADIQPWLQELGLL